MKNTFTFSTEVEGREYGFRNNGIFLTYEDAANAAIAYYNDECCEFDSQKCNYSYEELKSIPGPMMVFESQFIIVSETSTEGSGETFEVSRFDNYEQALSFFEKELEKDGEAPSYRDDIKGEASITICIYQEGNEDALKTQEMWSQGNSDRNLYIGEHAEMYWIVSKWIATEKQVQHTAFFHGEVEMIFLESKRESFYRNTELRKQYDSKK